MVLVLILSLIWYGAFELIDFSQNVNVRFFAKELPRGFIVGFLLLS